LAVVEQAVKKRIQDHEELQRLSLLVPKRPLSDGLVISQLFNELKHKLLTASGNFLRRQEIVLEGLVMSPHGLLQLPLENTLVSKVALLGGDDSRKRDEGR
jgi:hypothetical protein